MPIISLARSSRDASPATIRRSSPNSSAQLDALRGSSAIAILSRQGEIVIGQVYKTEVANDSALAIFDGSSGELLTTVGTGLHDIVGLAIGPQSGRLYAIDFASIAPEEGGLYRLDLKKDEGELICRATRLMPSPIGFDGYSLHARTVRCSSRASAR